MKARKLKNGAEEAEPMVRVGMAALRVLMEDDPIAFYELREKARDPKHELWGKTEQILKDRQLLENLLQN